MTNPTPLSQAAHAVLDAFVSNAGEGHRHQSTAVAAALRAAADQVVPADDLYARSCCEFIGESTRAALLAIAAELEAQ